MNRLIPRPRPTPRSRGSGARLATALAGAVAGLSALLVPFTVQAHSLDSSTVWVQVTQSSAQATLSIPVAALDTVLGTDAAADEDVAADDDQVVAYLDEHLTVTGADGVEWSESWSAPVRETIEGIDSLTIEVDFDTGTSSTDSFTIAYDAVVEAVDGHEAVVVLTDADNEVSSPGVIDKAGESVEIGGGGVAIGDMVHYGFAHVLQGADHLLFLVTLLLPAPLLLANRRWRSGGRAWSSMKNVIHVVTAFTVGHSITLLSSALGWVSFPSRPVEIVIAASVGVSAIHAIRPLAERGERIIAVAFGLVHGLAFAGILAELGLSGSTSLVALLSFNVGIELGQLAATAAVFPSLYLISRTRYYPALRVLGASLALCAAVGWVLDRIGVLTNPLAPLEDAAIAHPWRVVIGLAFVALTAWTVDRRASSPATIRDRRGVLAKLPPT